MSEIMVKNMPLKVGHTLTLTGVPTWILCGVPESDRFVVNIRSGDDLALHISVRFDEGRVVCNSHQGGAWGAEVIQGGFPFKHNELFKIIIRLTQEEFVVVLSDASEIHFPNRLGESEYLDFSFEKSVLVRSFEIN